MPLSVRRPVHQWSLSFLFWTAITLLFLYERTYLIQKAGLPHFVACVVFRVGSLLLLCQVHRYVVWARFFQQQAYWTYVGWLISLLAVYLVGQGLYDQYLFGFVIGDHHRGFLDNLPYNFLTTGWYLLLTTLLTLPTRPSAAPIPDQTPVPTLLIKSGTQWVRLPLCSLVYAEGLKDYTVLYSEESVRHIVKGSVGKLADQLPVGQFVRIHKSYWVAWKHVRSISATTVTLLNQTLPLGRTYATAVLRQWQQRQDFSS